MLFFFSGDREKTHLALDQALKNIKTKSSVRISEVNTPNDLNRALQGGGMFGEKQTAVFDGIFLNEEMRRIALENLKYMRDSNEHFFIIEEKIDAATRKQIEKYAQEFKKFDAQKKEQSGSVFELAKHMSRADKKKFWVGYQRELRSKDPEAILGALFWGAKQMLQYARTDADKKRAEMIIAELAELPHVARRQGMELEYALEKFILSIV